MSKALLLTQILSALESLHQSCVEAALQACDTATNKETVAENKYDTFGLEASYLARGQAKRVEGYKADIAAFKKLPPVDFGRETPIAVGALVTLKDEQGMEQSVFLGPASGGLKLQFNNKDIMLISRSSSLGAGMVGCSGGDEFEIDIDGKKTRYEVVAVE